MDAKILFVRDLTVENDELVKERVSEHIMDVLYEQALVGWTEHLEVYSEDLREEFDVPSGHVILSNEVELHPEKFIVVRRETLVLINNEKAFVLLVNL